MATVVSKFVRLLSADDLRSYFTFRNIETTGTVDWRAADAPLRQAVLELIEALPTPERTTVLVDADAILELADDAGHLAMQDVAANRDAMLAAFETIDSQVGRALWLFINDPEGFKRARRVRNSNRLRDSRSWSGFIAPSGASFNPSREALSALADACAEAYRKQGGFRGMVEVETFDRLASWRDDDGAGSVTQITIHAEEWPQSEENFGDDGLQPQLRRPPNTLYLTYCAADGAIDVMAKGGKSIRMKIAGLFARHLLGVDCDPEDVPMRELDLSLLADRRTLAVKTGGPIAEVDVKTVRFQPLDGASPYRILGKVKRSIYEDFPSRRLELPGYEIDRVVLTFAFLPAAGEQTGAKVTVALTFPNGCSGKGENQLHRLAIEEFLERSGLYRTIGPDDEEQIEAAE